MASGPSGKRKRSERQYSHDDAGRPSPHRPENLNLAQQNQHQSARGGGRGGGRRSSRQLPSSPAPNTNAAPATPKNTQTPTQDAPSRATPALEPSRPSTPSQRPTTPAPPAPRDEGPKEPPAPYAYDHLTDEVVGAWQESGRQAVLESTHGDDELVVNVVLQELIRAALDGRTEAAEAGAVVKTLATQHAQDADIPSLFLDTISLLDDKDVKNPALSRLVAATAIDPEVIRQELDVPLLVSLGLARTTFEQKRIRKTTSLLYRQANFNLLREETEGYAKLLTDYYNAASDSVLSDDTEMAKDAFHRIMALVGAFDLDVGRVLDITLDISASCLVKSFRFFVKFYRCSTWWPQNDMLDNIKWEDQGFGSIPRWALPGSGKWHTTDEDKVELALLRQSRDVAFWDRAREVGVDAFFELGARKIINYDHALPILETELPAQLDAKGKESNADKRKRINEDRKYMRETRTLPPPGNADAAQLLGFKLRFYASAARDPEDVLFENLVYLAALLIKIGFISLRDLWPHLHPSHEAMEAEKERLEKEKAEKERKERPGGGMNALLAAGALADDTIPAVRGLRNEAARSGGSSPKTEKKEEEAKDELPEPLNQKLILLKALLAIGALPEALFILGAYPWLVEVDSSLPPYLHRIVSKMLSKVGDDTRPLTDRLDMQDTKKQLSDATPAADGSLKLQPRPKTRHRRHLGLDEPDNGDGLEQKHYYQDWDDNIPVCQNADDVLTLCDTFLGYLGVKVGTNALNMTRLLRVAKKSLEQDSSESNRARWLELMKRTLVPALSLTKHNAEITDQAWKLLKMYNISTRYDIYADWFTGRTSRLPDMKVALDRNKAEVKDVLRRITNESGKKGARALGKVSLASPGIVCMTFINQLESYSNMIPGLVESVRYFSFLAYDVLTWCLINALSGTGRSRIQADGMLTSPWLQALSLFVAALFTRYPIITASPVLQYVASELRNGDSTDLELIDQVLAEMAGIKSDMNFNDVQVVGMTGGELLQSQMVQQVADQRHLKKATAKRLISILSGAGLTGQILISIAQERQMYPHRPGAKDMPLKVLANNLDKIQQVFAQYMDVLRSNVTPTEFESLVPDVLSLIGEFGLEPGTAFAICRGSILHRMAEVDAAKREQQSQRSKSQEKVQKNVDAEMKDVEAAVAEAVNNDSPALKTESAVNSEAKQTEDTQVEDNPNASQVKESTTPTPSAQPSSFAITNGDVAPWHPTLEPIMEGFSGVAGEIAARVSVPFYVTFWTLSPQDVFVPMNVYSPEVKRLDAEVLKLRDNKNLSSAARAERERNRKALADLSAKLHAEMSTRISGPRGLGAVKMWLNTQKKHWFPRQSTKSERVARHLALLQDCFLPRSMMSAVDAHYCLQIIETMQKNATPGFSTLILLDQLFNKQRLHAIISQCTSREADNFGRFLFEFLKLLAGWHAKQADYEKEALGSQRQYHGFAKSVDADGAPTSQLEYEEFRRLLTNWHNALSNALKICLTSGEYMQVRNGIAVLKAVVTVFPALTYQGTMLFETLNKLGKNEERIDLQLSAKSLQGPLKAREKSWVKPQDFRLGGEKEGGTGGSRAPSAMPETPQPGDGPKLNASAPAFKPAAVVKLAQGDGRKKSQGSAEDGEISDEKAAAKADIKMNDAPAVKDGAPKPEAARGETPRGPAKDLARVESKPSTPAPAATPRQPPPSTNGTPRHDASRDQVGPRPGSSLPPRPEGSPNKPLPATPSDRSFRGNGERFGRLDRPEDGRVPPSRERSPAGHRSRQRTPERDSREPYGPPPSHAGGYRDERAPVRPPLPEQQYPGPADRRNGPPLPEQRYPREDQRNGTRREPLPPHPGPPPRPASESRDRNNAPSGPPVASSPHPDRLNQLRTESGPSSRQQESRPSPSVTPAPTAAAGHAVNPERAALMAADERRGDRSQGHNRDGRHDERFARDAAPRPDNRSNGRPGPPENSREQTAPRVEPASDIAPTGPRAGRASGGRELFDPANQPRNMQEPPRGGRFSQNMGPPSQAQESSYGRLNVPPVAPTPSQEVPSGPRAPNGPAARGGRNNFTAPMTSSVAQPASTRTAEPAATPRGPRDGGRRESGAPNDRQMPSSSQPTTPANESAPMAGMHPSRMAAFSPGMPPPLQTALAHNGPQAVASPTTGPPVGPRGSNRPPVGAPTGPSPTTSVASGPAKRQDVRGDRQFANLNAHLAGATNGPPQGGQNTSFRGAANVRQASFSGQPSSSGPPQIAPSPAVASPMDAPPRRDAAPSRPDGLPNRPESRADLMQRPDERESGRSRRYEDDRGEHRQRGSRHPSRDRRPDDEAPRRPFAPGVEDGRRGTPRGGDERRPQRDERSSRDAAPRDSRRGREDEPPSRRPPLPDAQVLQYGNNNVPPPPPPPEQQWDRGPRREQPLPPPPPPTSDDRRGGHRSSRHDEPRRGPSREEAPMSRKRGYEEGPAGPNDPKRRRSGR